MEQEEVLFDIIDRDIYSDSLRSDDGILIGSQHLRQEIDEHEDDEDTQDRNCDLVFVLEELRFDLIKETILVYHPLSAYLMDLGFAGRPGDSIGIDESECFFLYPGMQDILEEIRYMTGFRFERLLHILEIIGIQDVRDFGAHIEDIIIAFYISFYEIGKEIDLASGIGGIGERIIQFIISEDHHAHIADHGCHEDIVYDDLHESFDLEEIYITDLISECLQLGVYVLECEFKM